MPRSEPTDRELLIALAADPALPRPAACRLGLALGALRRARRTEDLVALGLPARAAASALALPGAARELARREEAAAARLEARILTALDAELPAALAELALPPPALWVAGEIPALPAVAVVGARAASPYGLEIAGWFGRELAGAGALVVSGFALGVDGAAHRGALEAEGGRTLAVLGCGLGVDYPRPHARLGREIRAQGALVTEFPCGLAPEPWRFPVRNRLIAALARALVVVEAAPKSGSLITARLALDLGREVLAVPGRLTDELALGPNALLADGAAPALAPGDLLEAIGLESGRAPRRAAVAIPLPAGLTPPARALAAAVDPVAPAAAEELAARAGLAIDVALGALLELELTGVVRRLPGGGLVRCGG